MTLFGVPLTLLLVQAVNGLMEGMLLFLMASGLTLIFGVSRIVNFAHGSLYMLGAFLTFQFVPAFGAGTLGGFAAAVLVSALAVGVAGALFERLVLRRLYGGEELMQLIITVALVLVIRDVVKAFWGLDDRTVPAPAVLAGGVQIGTMTFPALQLAMFGASLFVLLVMVAVIRFTRAGILLRAATDDRGMVALLGIDSKLIFTAVVGVGSFLAGLAGGLAAPFGNVNYLLDTGIIVDAFIVCVIGGLGSINGTLAAALAVGLIKALGIVWMPRGAMVLIFVLMAVVLIARSLRRSEVTR
jgi:branched-chain amino acid transport system permease protein